MLNTYYLLFLFVCFIIVVIIETNVMRKFFKTETFGELVRINLASNGLSKSVGLPIAFFISFILQLLTLSLFGWGALILAIPFTILLLFIAYHISVWIEQWVITKFWGNKYKQETIAQAVRSANKASSVFIFVACVFIFYAINRRDQSKSDRLLQQLRMEDEFDHETETEEVA